MRKLHYSNRSYPMKPGKLSMNSLAAPLIQKVASFEPCNGNSLAKIAETAMGMSRIPDINRVKSEFVVIPLIYPATISITKIH